MRKLLGNFSDNVYFINRHWHCEIFRDGDDVREIFKCNISNHYLMLAPTSFAFLFNKNAFAS